MLKRSASDLKLRHADSAEAMVGGPKSKREILASLRRSFRRKPKASIFQSCNDDFASFSSHSASSTPQNIRKRTNTYAMPDNTSNSVSSTGYLSNMSDSDTGNSTSHSPVARRSHRTSECEDVTVAEKLSLEEDVNSFATDGKLVG